jgi:hypothetical protein
VRAAAISELKVSGPSVFGGLRRKAGARSLIASRGADHFRAQRPKLGRGTELAGAGAAQSWRVRRSFTEMPVRNAGGAKLGGGWARARSWRAGRSCFWAGPMRAGRNCLTRHSLGGKGEAVLQRHPHPAGVGLSSPSDQPLRRLRSLRGFSHVFRDLKTSALTIPLRGFAKPRNYPPPPMGFLHTFQSFARPMIKASSIGAHR